MSSYECEKVGLYKNAGGGFRERSGKSRATHHLNSSFDGSNFMFTIDNGMGGGGRDRVRSGSRQGGDFNTSMSKGSGLCKGQANAFRSQIASLA